MPAAHRLYRIIIATTLGGIGIVTALASAGQAVAEPQWTDTQVHGGANAEVRESGYNQRDSTHDMPLYHSQGTWCCQVEVRPPDVVAVPRATTGG